MLFANLSRYKSTFQFLGDGIPFNGGRADERDGQSRILGRVRSPAAARMQTPVLAKRRAKARQQKQEPVSAVVFEAADDVTRILSASAGLYQENMRD